MAPFLGRERLNYASVTLSAYDGGGQLVVSATYGPVTVRVADDVAELRHFWGELGDLLDRFEKKNPTSVPDASPQGIV